MTEILLTSALTITGGILVIVCGQICIRFFIEPVHEVQKAIGDVSDALIYHANLYRGSALARVDPSLVSEAALNASVALRQKAVLLLVKANAVWGYHWFARLHMIPPWNELEAAHTALMALSKGVLFGNPDANSELAKFVADILKLRIGDLAWMEAQKK